MSSIESILIERSGEQCELCKSTDALQPFVVSPKDSNSADDHAFLCVKCVDQIKGAELNANHWRCLNDSMWTPVPAVQVLAWRMLNRLKVEPWAQDLLDMLYLDEALLEWAKQGADQENDEQREPTRDSNGTQLHAGDNVTIIKDLNVKGAGFTAKRGTAVRNISLTDNPEHIEGRVNGVRIVLLSCYLKKS